MKKLLFILSLLTVSNFASAQTDLKDCIEIDIHKGSESYDKRGHYYKVAFKNNCSSGVSITIYSESKKGEEKTCCIRVEPGHHNTGNQIVSSTGIIDWEITKSW